MRTNATRHLEESIGHALTLPGCPVCRIVHDEEPHYWESIAQVRVDDPTVMAAVRDAVGYSARHLSQLTARHDALLSALVASAALDGALATLSSGVRPGERCPACEAMAQLERSSLEVLARLAAEAHGAHRLETSHGICVTHLACAATMPRLDAERLRADTDRRLEAMREELLAYVESLARERKRLSEHAATAPGRAFRLLRGSDQS